jgi:hypothetical protein
MAWLTIQDLLYPGGSEHIAGFAASPDAGKPPRGKTWFPDAPAWKGKRHADAGNDDPAVR